MLVVSDAGMPTINDPGLAIVRRAIERGLPVTCAPGPSAVLDALALSGLPTDRFCYEGFLPRKHSERVQYLRTLLPERRTIVFYETPHRIADSMDDLLDAFGPNRPMALCRELTKDYEQIRRGPIDEIRQSVIDDPPRGEMVLVIGGASNEEAEAAAPSTLSVDDMAVLSIDRALEDGLRIKDAIAQVVQEHPLADGSLANRKQVYAAVLKTQGIAQQPAIISPLRFHRLEHISNACRSPGPTTLRDQFQQRRVGFGIGNQPFTQFGHVICDVPEHGNIRIGRTCHRGRKSDGRFRRRGHIRDCARCGFG